MKRIALLPLLLAGVAFGQEAKGPYDAAMALIQQRAERIDKTADMASTKCWPGVYADARAKMVTILTCATGIKRTEPVEFYVAPLDSGKDYEALTVTPAKPSDVAAALQFAGFTPGLPVDPDKNRFWARGQRLKVTFITGGKIVDSGDVLLDTNTGKRIPGTLLFAGSYTKTDAQGVKHLAADEADARPLAPDYEDPASVLAVPRRAPQNAVYGFQKVSPAAEWKQGELVEVILQAADPKDSLKPWPSHISVRMENGAARYDVMAAPPRDAEVISWFDDLPHLVEFLARPVGVDHFVTVSASDSTPVTKLRALFSVLQAMEADGGVKIDPPPIGGLYYRAFFPDPQWRDRSKRLGEPWDLFLARDATGKLSAKLEHATEDPAAAADAPPVLSSTTPTDPAVFVATINANPSKWSRAIFIYPPADLTYGELMAWVKPALATYPRIFVFPPAGATTQPATQPQK